MAFVVPTSSTPPPLRAFLDQIRAERAAAGDPTPVRDSIPEPPKNVH